MQTSRIEEQLSVALLPDSFCSVYWLIPDSPEELPGAIAKVTTSTDTVPWGMLGRWEQSSKMQAMVSEIAHATHLGGELRIGGTRILGDLLALPRGESDWFWTEFARPLYPYQICAVLLPHNASVRPGLTYAGLHPIQVERSRFLGGSW